MNFNSYLKSKGCSHTSIKSYTRQSADYLKWLKTQDIEPEQATHRDLLAYVKHCQRQGNTQRTIQTKLGSISHYYDHLREQEQIITNPVKGIELRGVKRNTLHPTLEPHQLHQLYQNYQAITRNQKRNRVALGLVVYQGLKTAELIRLAVQDLHIRAGEMTVQGSRKGNERKLKLESHQIFDLYDYLQKIRPELIQRDSQRLFVVRRFDVITRAVLTQVRKINPQVKNLQQLRASVITQWLKRYNLREVQYRAGHRYVSSTEKYKQNDLEGLQEEINRFHPLG